MSDDTRSESPESPAIPVIDADDEVSADDEEGPRRSLLAEELTAGSDDPSAQAQAILEDSEERTLDRDAAPGSSVEHRHSEDLIDPS